MKLANDHTKLTPYMYLFVNFVNRVARNVKRVFCAYLVNRVDTYPKITDNLPHFNANILCFKMHTIATMTLYTCARGRPRNVKTAIFALTKNRCETIRTILLSLFLLNSTCSAQLFLNVYLIY